MKRGTGGSGCLPALIAVVSVVWLLIGVCTGIWGAGLARDPQARNAPSGVWLLTAACAATTGASMVIRWVTKRNRTPDGEAVNLRLVWIGLALLAGGFVAMLVGIAKLT